MYSVHTAYRLFILQSNMVHPHLSKRTALLIINLTDMASTSSVLPTVCHVCLVSSFWQVLQVCSSSQYHQMRKGRCDAPHTAGTGRRHGGLLQSSQVRSLLILLQHILKLMRILLSCSRLLRLGLEVLMPPSMLLLQKDLRRMRRGRCQGCHAECTPRCPQRAALARPGLHRCSG